MNNEIETELEIPEEQVASRLGFGVGGLDLAIFVLIALIAGALGYWLGARQSGGPGANSAEAGFARDMTTHHAQAVELATLIRERSDDPELRQVALDILLTQQAQLGQMQGWLNTWGYPLANAGPAMAWMGVPMTGMPVSGLMPGMATPEQLNQLRGLQGVDAEILFLQLMITHHRSGVDMGRAALDRVKRPEVRALAQSIVDAQVLEIELMEGMLEQEARRRRRKARKPREKCRTPCPRPDACKEAGWSGFRELFRFSLRIWNGVKNRNYTMENKHVYETEIRMDRFTAHPPAGRLAAALGVYPCRRTDFAA